MGLKKVLWAIRDHDPLRYLHRWRRAVLVARIRAAAFWHRATVELDLAPDLRVGRDVRVEVTPWSRNVLRIGPRSTLKDRVTIQLKGGEVLLGPETELRKDVVLNVGGRFVFEHHNILSYGVVLHCAESVVLEPYAGIAELATVADSTHFFTTPDEFFYDNVRTSPIRIGGNTWVCPRASITSGVTVGSHCIVGSNSVVVGDVPDGHLASGIPAANRPLKLPWKQTA